MSKLVDTFNSRFRVVSADTRELTSIAQKIRYQVYCIENPYEEARYFPDGKERDEYDYRSTHAMIQCRKTGLYSGVVRLVLPDPAEPALPLPIEKHCADSLAEAGFTNSSFPRESVAEISRFSVSKEYKSRCARSTDYIRAVETDSEGATSPKDEVDKRMVPHITLGLFAGVLRMSLENNITHWLAVMEPTLIRFLTRFGVFFKPVGETVEYHGVRQPAIAEVDEVLTSIFSSRRDVWDLVTDNGRLYPVPELPQVSVNYGG